MEDKKIIQQDIGEVREGVNDNALPDSLDGLVEDIRDELDSYNESQDIKTAIKTSKDVSTDIETLEKMLKEVDLDSLPNPEDVNRFIVGKASLNIQQIDVLINDMFQAMVKSSISPNNNTLRTLAELIRTKNETIGLLSEHIVNKDRVEIEKIKVNLMGNLNGELNGNKTSTTLEDANKVATKTINQLIEERIDEELNKKNENFVDVVEKAMHVDKLDSNGASTQENKKSTDVSLDDLLE